MSLYLSPVLDNPNQVLRSQVTLADGVNGTGLKGVALGYRAHYQGTQSNPPEALANSTIQFLITHGQEKTFLFAVEVGNITATGSIGAQVRFAQVSSLDTGGALLCLGWDV